MKTGQYHDDYQSQREFERLKDKSSSQQTQQVQPAGTVTRTGIPTASEPGDARATNVESPLGTILVQKYAGGYRYEIERFFTALHNGVPILVRTDESRTLEEIDFEDTASVTWTLDSTQEDRVRIRATVIGASSILQLQDNNVNVGASDTSTIDFVDTATVSWVITDLGAGERRVEANVIGSGSGMTSWILEDSDENVTINDGDSAIFLGSKGVVVELDTATKTIDISRPLSVEKADFAIGADNVISLDFHDSSTITWIISDDGGGERRITADVAGGVFMQSFTIADAVGSTVITDGETITVLGDKGVVVSLNTGTNTYTVSRALQLQENGTDVADDDVTLMNFIGTAAGADRVPVEFDILSTGDKSRSIQAYVPAYPVFINYRWKIYTNDDPTTQHTVNSDTAVNIAAGPGIRITQLQGRVMIEAMDMNPGAIGGRWIRGRIELDDPGLPAPGYHGVKVYAEIEHNWSLDDMRTVDLVLYDEIWDSARVGAPTVFTHRGNAAAWGTDIQYGNVVGSSIPFVTPIDEDTIGVYATLPKLKLATPTPIRFWFVLHEVP